MFIQPRIRRQTVAKALPGLCTALAWLLLASAPLHAQNNGNVYVSRFWHNHQPIYWPEWNGTGQNSRVQHAWDSIVLKGGQTYSSGVAHPENDLVEIFGKSDRVQAYQGGPSSALGGIPTEAGFAMSYSGSLIDNVRNLAASNQLGYGGGWWSGNRAAKNWETGNGPNGGRRMDLVGFTYHHSLAPLLPKAVFRKELQIFKQAWWKAWDGDSNLSDHSKGFFPTEMAFTSELVDVLVDEGYQWSIVASHHLSRTCPTYNTKANPTGNFNIKSSPPNKADQTGPSPTGGWWFNEPNPGNAAWNVSPFAYQLHKVKYVNPNNGNEKSLIVVPSDDTESYVAGYSGAQKGMIDSNITPYASDSNRPVIVLPSTDGDNAWGGGSSSYFESTPAFFNACKSGGYKVTSIQDFVNWHGAAAGTIHVEDGAWIFPESDYGSPYFLKWIEPPVGAAASTTKYPGTVIDLETPGFALKFWAWAPIITGANWVETAEQILRDENGSVEAWKIQAPYDWDGTWTSPNEVERAWHIYLAGLDSGFNYYGGLGNDDEVKPSLATRRAIELLDPWMTTTRRDNDRTPPSVLRPQRFPWNPGGYTFGWFNSIPGGDTRYLKKMPSEFYIWTHAYDLSGVPTINVKVRVDNDGTNTLANNQNETYAGGPDVGSWISIPMTKRVLPKTQSELNAAANNGQINYFITPPQLADYYFAKITNGNVSGFRNKLLDYYIEATDSKNNTHKSEIQHVFVEDDGAVSQPPATPTGVTATGISSTQITVSWPAVPDATGYVVRRDGVEVGTTGSTSYTDGPLAPSSTHSYTVVARNAVGDSSQSQPPALATTQAPPPTPDVPTGLTASPVSHTQIDLSWNTAANANTYVLKRAGLTIATIPGTAYSDKNLSPFTTYTYTIAAANSGDTSIDSSPLTATTLALPQNYIMDGAADFAGYRISNQGMTIYAALRGSRLYVATWSPGNSGGLNDHFIFVTDSLLPAATASPPWGKAGSVAVATTKPYLAAESINNYAGWANAPGGSELAKAASSSGQIEGSIDLAEAFGTVPPTVYIAAVAYQTDNGGIIGAQAPAGNGDGNLDPAEFLALPTNTIIDRNADGVLDRLDPSKDFVISIAGMGAGTMQISWAVVPGRTYGVEFVDSLGGTWGTMSGTPVTAASGEMTLSIADASGMPHRFYRVRLLNP